MLAPQSPWDTIQVMRTPNALMNDAGVKRSARSQSPGASDTELSRHVSKRSQLRTVTVTPTDMRLLQKIL